MAKVISVLCLKGGVGKTAVSSHLAWAAQEAGMTVLVADVDTQGTASQRLSGDMGIKKRRNGGAEQLWLNDENAGLHFHDGAGEGMKILHGHPRLERLDGDGDLLVKSERKETRQRIRALPFDRIIFDTPPCTGVRMALPLFCTDLLIIVVEPTIECLGGIEDTIDVLKAGLQSNPQMKFKVVINKVRRVKAHRELVDALHKQFSGRVIGELGLRQPVESALSVHTPVWRHREADAALRKQWKGLATDIVNLNV